MCEILSRLHHLILALLLIHPLHWQLPGDFAGEGFIRFPCKLLPGLPLLSLGLLLHLLPAHGVGRVVGVGVGVVFGLVVNSMWLWVWLVTYFLLDVVLGSWGRYSCCAAAEKQTLSEPDI